MKTKIQMLVQTSFSTLAAGLVAFLLLSGAANVASAQAIPPGVQDVIKLSQAGISDEVILTQIKNTGATYNLTADQIIYLKNLGISQTVIKALMGGGGTPVMVAPAAPAPMIPAPPATPAPVVPVPTPAVPVPAAPVVNLNTIQPQLAPYGNWIQVPGYGSCWQPAVAISDPAWRPYFDQGHWIYTDAGWSWQSDYSWGGIVFHYGRWCRFNGGWVWMPGYDWAPAWVCWREADDYCGWAPLPPAATYKVGVGLFFNGQLALNVDFGLGVDDFTFVAYAHFWDSNLRPFFLPHNRVVVFFPGSHVLNGYRVDNGRFVVEGLGRDHIAAVTHHDIRIEPDLHDSRAPWSGNPDNRGGYDNRGGRGNQRDQRDQRSF